MKNLVEIENAIQNLSPNELREFQNWFTDYKNNMWDQQIERDCKNGKFDTLIQETLEEFDSGACTEI